MNTYEYIYELVSSEFSGDASELELITDEVYSVVGESEFSSEDEFVEAVLESIPEAIAYCTASDEELELYAELDEAAPNYMFSEEEFYNADQMVFNSDEVEQDEYAFYDKRDGKRIAKDINRAGVTLGIMAPRASWMKRTWNKLSGRTPKSTVGHAWAAASSIVKSPIGQLAVGTSMVAGQNKLNDFISKKFPNFNRALHEPPTVNFSATEILEDLVAGAPTNTESKVQDRLEAIEAVALPKNTVLDAEDARDPSNNIEVSSDLKSSISDHVDAESEQNTEAPVNPKEVLNDLVALPNAVQLSYSEEQDIYAKNNNQGGFYGKDGNAVVGTLGSGSDARDYIKARMNQIKIGKKDNLWNRIVNPGANKHDGNYLKMEGLVSALRGTMVDAVTEGLLTGTYYQSLDTGLKLSNDSIKRTRSGLSALVTPTLDKLQAKLETAGSRFANWAMPDGPSGAEIIDGMSDKDATEIIKTLDTAGWLNKLTEPQRVKFLMNLSKSGVCYIDERGTLKKRNIIDRLLKMYETNPDNFFEALPGELEAIEELYKTTSLVSKDSIKTDAVYNRLKGATSYDQVKSILNDELNVVRKPLISLSELGTALSNDFISLYKTDRIYFKSVIDKIARSVETMVRANGADSLSAISRAFLRGLAMSSTESEIRRTTEKLLIANVKYFNGEYDVAPSDAEFAEEELNIEGANANVENTDVKSTDGQSTNQPSSLGMTAGYDDKDVEKEKTGEGDLAAKIKEEETPVLPVPASTNFTAVYPANQSHFSTSDIVSTQSESVCAPGFGLSALQ